MTGVPFSYAMRSRASKVLSHAILPVELTTSTPPKHAGAAGNGDDSSRATVVPGSSAAAAVTASRATETSLSRQRTYTLLSPTFFAPCTMRDFNKSRYRAASELVSANLARASSNNDSIACSRAASTFKRIAFRPVDASIFFAVSTVISLRSYSFAILIFSPSTMESFSMLNSSSVAMAISRAFSFASCLMNCTICARSAWTRRRQSRVRVVATGRESNLSERRSRKVSSSSRARCRARDTREDARERRDAPG